MKLTEMTGLKSVLVGCALALTCSVAAPVAAASVGVNFAMNSSDSIVLASDSAGLVAQQNWNNLVTVGSSGATSALTDDSGAASGVSVSWSNVNNTYFGAYVGSSAASGDQKLFHGMIEGQYSGATTGPNLSVSGVSFASYDVYVYMGDVFSSVASVTVNGDTRYYQGSNSFTSTGFVAATSTSAASTPTATYALFSGLTGSAFDIDLQKISGNRSTISGFQIVETMTPVPLPAALPLLFAALGGLGMAARRRTKG